MNKKTLTPIILAGIFFLMLGLSFAAVPLYDLFCRVTGFGGTTQNAENKEIPKIVINKDYKINLYTDSNYVKDGITSWISNWKKNNWKTANKKDVKNKDLWIRLDSAIKGKDISWIWVKGHAGNAGNEQADYLARSALEKL